MRDTVGDKVIVEDFGDDEDGTPQVFIQGQEKGCDGTKRTTAIVLNRKKLKKLYRKCMAILDGNTGDNTRVNTVKQEN